MASTEQTKSKSAAAFSKHSQEERNRLAGADANNGPTRGKMSIRARVGVFLGFPAFVGLMGLFTSYLKVKFDKTGEHTVNFDTDFVTPFLLAMAMVIVIGFQTQGYATKERTPFVAWPKTRTVKKVTRQRVIVDEDGNEVAPEDMATLKAWKEKQEKKGRSKKEE